MSYELFRSSGGRASMLISRVPAMCRWMRSVLLARQTNFINRCIRSIMALYTERSSTPRSVILIGHSMGGMVARAVVTRPDYVPGSVRTIITLNTPHQYGNDDSNTDDRCRGRLVD